MFTNAKLLSFTTLVLALASLVAMLPSGSASPATSSTISDFDHWYTNQHCRECRVSSYKNIKEGGTGEAKTYDDVKKCARELVHSLIDPHADRGSSFDWTSPWETETSRDIRFQDFKSARRSLNITGIDIKGWQPRTPGTWFKEGYKCDDKRTADFTCATCEDVGKGQDADKAAGNTSA